VRTQLYLSAKDAQTQLPARPRDDDSAGGVGGGGGDRDNGTAAPHPFTGFYLDFQPAAPAGSMFSRLDRPSAVRGLVSTAAAAGQSEGRPATLHWVYADRRTREVRYGSREAADGHILSPLDWTDDEQGLTLEGWEGFVAVEEENGMWAVYYDRDDDLLKGRVAGKRVLRCSLERRLVQEDDDEEEEVFLTRR
jgi:hypothetical protein